MRVVILILATALFVLSGSPLLAQRDYPATATIRGENIWLRIDPAEDTEVLAYLQRGDPIRVTGDAVPADGDAFYPIEVVETGETGWVRDLAVDPRSFHIGLRRCPKSLSMSHRPKSWSMSRQQSKRHLSRSRETIGNRAEIVKRATNFLSAAQAST